MIPLRIAHVIETLGVGGAEVLLADVTARLDRQRFLSHVLALDGPADLSSRIRSQGTRVEVLGRSPRLAPLRCLFALRRALAATRPHIVHTHLYYANVLGRIASVGSAARVVTTLHNPDYTYEANATTVFRTKKLLDRLTGTRNSALLAVSRAVAEDFTAHMRWRCIQVVPNGVDLNLFTPGPPVLAHLWPSDAVRLLAVGRLHPQKGFGVLLDALALVVRRERKSQWGLVIAGEGPLSAQLRDRSCQLGLEECVRFVGLRPDVRDLMRSAEVFVFPSLYEAFGLSLLEALACGCAAVASRTGGIPEIVVHGEGALLVEPGDPYALADAIRTLASAPERRRQLGERGRDRAALFGIERTVAALERIYTAIARSRLH